MRTTYSTRARFLAALTTARGPAKPDRLLRLLLASWLLLLIGSAASAQTIYVDTGGSDAFDGSSPNFQGGLTGPVATFARALQLAGPGSDARLISVEAGAYDEPLAISRGNLSFEARLDPQNGASEVLIRRAVSNNAAGTRFGFSGAGTFRFGDDASDALTLAGGTLQIAPGKVALTPGIQITRQSSAALAGTPQFLGAVDLRYLGGNTAAGPEMPLSMAAGSRLRVDLGSNGVLTLAGPVQMAGGARVSVAMASARISGGITITGAGAQLEGPGTLGDITIAPMGEATLSGAPQVASLTNAGTARFAGQTLVVYGNLINTGAIEAGSLQFLGTGTAIFQAGPNFVADNLTLGNGTDSKTVTFQQDVRLLADLLIRAGATANLDGFLITMASAGATATVNGVANATDDGGLLFGNTGQTLAGNGILSNIVVQTGAGNASRVQVAASPDGLRFTGILALNNGGLDITSSSLSPAGPMARVRVSVPMGGNIAGNFNADEVRFDLIYIGVGDFVAGTEFKTNTLRNVLVDVRGAGTLDASAAPAGTISGTLVVRSGDRPATPAIEQYMVQLPAQNVAVQGAVTVENNAAVNTAAPGWFRFLASSNTVQGAVLGSGMVQLAGGVSVDGAGGLQARLGGTGEVRVLAGATATIAGMRLIGADLVLAANTSALTLSMAAPGGNPGDVAGSVIFNNGTLTLASAVDVAGAEVRVAGGRLNFASHELRLIGAGAFFSGSGSAVYTAADMNGALHFAATGQRFSIAGREIPNVHVSHSVALETAAIVAQSYRQRAAGAAMVSAGADADLTLRGVAQIAGQTIFTGPTLASELYVNGLVMSLQAAADASSVRQTGAFRINSPGSASVDFAAQLYRQDAGELDLQRTNLVFPEGGLVYDYYAGSVVSSGGAITDEGLVSTGGEIVFNAGAVTQQYRLAQALSVPRLRVSAGDGTGSAGIVEAAGTGRTLTVREYLGLDEGFFRYNAVTGGNLSLGSGATVHRITGSLPGAPASPSFPPSNDLRYVYGDQADSGMARYRAAFAGQITTGRELAPQAAHLTVWDDTRLASSTAISDQIRIAARFDAVSADGPGDWAITLRAIDPNRPPYTTGHLILEGQDALIVDDLNPATNEILFPGAYHLTYRGITTPLTREFTNAVDRLRIDRGSAITLAGFTPSRGAAYTPTPQDLEIEAGSSLDMNGRSFAVAHNTTFERTDALRNGSGGAAEFRFVGPRSGLLNLPVRAAGDPDEVRLETRVPAGISIVVHKDAAAATVAMRNSALVFSDDFDGDNAADDEALVLKRGVLVAGMPAERETVYIRLDHTNSSFAAGTSDNGQGFRWSAPSTALRPQSHVAGNLRKRIVSMPDNHDLRPGRVSFPLGSDAGRYGGMTLDFESNHNGQHFGQRELMVSYVPQAPGGQNGLPIADGVAPGVPVAGYPDFHWHVSSSFPLGIDTRFNVEAHGQAYVMEAGESVADLRMIRRQSGDARANPYTLVAPRGSYDNYLVDPTPGNPGSGDEYPVVAAMEAVALVGPQGTLFSFGTATGIPVPANAARIQVAHSAPSAPTLVDVYVNGERVADNLRFGTATLHYTMQEIDGSQEIEVAVAGEHSTGPEQATRTRVVPVFAGGVYTLLVVDELAQGLHTQSADLMLVSAGTAAAAGSADVEVMAVHASPDAPELSVRIAGSNAPVVAGLARGTASTAVTFDASLFTFELLGPDGAVIHRARMDLSAAAGERGMLLVQGLLAGDPTRPSRNLRLVFVRPGGQVIQSLNATSDEDGPVGIALPAEFSVLGSYPNPTRGAAALRFDLPAAADVSVEVYDLTGRRVMQLAQQGIEAGAARAVAVGAADLPAGVYLYHVRATSGTETWTGSGRFTVIR